MKTGQRRLAAFAVVAATMLLALVGVVTPAWAEGGSTTPHLPVKDNKVTIASKLTMDDNAMVPNVKFNYSIVPASESECTSTGGMPVTPGVDGAVSLSPDSVNYSDKGLTSANVDGTKTITAQLSAVLNTTEFTAPGIYRYKITQQNPVLDGLSVQDPALFLDVYVENNVTGYVVKGCTLSAEAGSGKKTDGFVNDYATHKLTIKKIVAGNQGDKKKDFKFTVSFSGATGETYKYVKVKKDGTSTPEGLANSGSTVSMSLSDGDSVTFYGLSSEDTYAVTEGNYTQEGYETSYKIGETGNETKSNTISATRIGAFDTTVTFTNTKEATVPTDVIRTVVPYVAIVAFAAVMGVVFFRPRRNRR